ncbi:MAG: sodium-dependent transporter [Ruminococcaceae bacterium]|nr:sodium-dependent transporter [Oscillospiraceae bacterium]
MSQQRSTFSGKIGFVLATAGSAVGLGNLWRFPYLVAQYGGGIFLLIYVILAFTFGFSLMCAEIAIGRKTGTSAIGAYKKLDKRFAFLGSLASIVPVIILPYYSVIGGWILKYLSLFAAGSSSLALTSDYFNNYIAKPIEPVGWFLLYIALTTLIVLSGVEKGVEKVSRFMMPTLVILTIFIAIYSLFMPGAIDGLIYYIRPDFSKFSWTTLLAATGQLFYSMSLAMGIMITFGSYMKKDVNIESSVKQIELFDTGIAFFSGLMIIPSVFAFSGGDKSALGKGPGLMFVTLPKVFESMAGGTIIGAIFFLLVSFAALTSSISGMETVVSVFMDKFKWQRKSACIIVVVICIILGLPSCLGYGVFKSIRIMDMDILTFFDFISNSVIMPIVALFTCILVGYAIKPEAIIKEFELSGKFKRKRLFTVMIKYIAPVFIVGILIFSILEGVGVVKV